MNRRIDENRILIDNARSYIMVHHPEWDKSLALKAVVKDQGSYWEVTFELPPMAIGGVPIIEVDKRSNEIIRALHTQ